MTKWIPDPLVCEFPDCGIEQPPQEPILVHPMPIGFVAYALCDAHLEKFAKHVEDFFAPNQSTSHPTTESAAII